jgi:hypothetical protein
MVKDDSSNLKDNNNIKDDRVQFSSMMLGSALLFFSSGMIGGMYSVFRREKTRFSPNLHGTPAMIASKALLYVRTAM